MKFFLPSCIIAFFVMMSIPSLVTSDHICTKYTEALFTNNTAENQLTLITMVVNLAVLGDADMNVTGILAAEGGLSGFFSGAAGNTTNRGGTAVSINFLDNSTNQETLFEHLYQFFGALLGCEAAGFPDYTGIADMYEVHKFMGITLEQNDYFISQVGASAIALGVTVEDATAVGNVLDSVFNTRCTPILTESDAVPELLVGTNPSICQDDSCPLHPNATCVEDGGETTLCSKYTTAVFKNDTADNQLALITMVVNLAVLGDADMDVAGILAAEGGLSGFFSGAAGNTTNRGGTAVSINFLDNATNQETLLEHLYQFFGALLGCTAAGFPEYTGVPDMYEVHKFMGITLEQNDYFISQVGASAIALGVTMEDATAIGNVLDSVFNTRCPPPLTSSDGVPEFLVGTNPSICQDDSCPVAMNSVDTTCTGVNNSAPSRAPSTSDSNTISVAFGTTAIVSMMMPMMMISMFGM